MTHAAPLPTLNTLWLGSQLGDLELACLESAVRVGHRLRVFSYDKLDRLPEGAEAVHASEVMSFDLLSSYMRRSTYSLAANIWRYALLRNGPGVWIDADFYLLRPIVASGDYLFGWLNEKRIGNGVLRLPPDSELLKKLWDFVSNESTAGSLDQLPRTTTGPIALTRFALETGDARWAVERRVFHPIPWLLNVAVYQPTGDWRRFCSDQTVAIHLWRHTLPDSLARTPTAGTLLHDIFECHRKGSGVLSLTP
jgi:hypothetical protein